MFLSPWANRARVCPDLDPFTCHEPGITHQVIPTGRDRSVTLNHSLHVRLSVGGAGGLRPPGGAPEFGELRAALVALGKLQVSSPSPHPPFSFQLESETRS